MDFPTLKWVEVAAIRPHHCAAVPYIGNSNSTKGFIDTGSELPGFDNRVYLSVEYIEDCARQMGFVEKARADITIHSLRRQVAELEKEVNELRPKVEAISLLRLPETPKVEDNVARVARAKKSA